MKIIIDIDGTICEERSTFERSIAPAKPLAREVISELRSKGHYLILYTSRGWSEYLMTEDWLKRHGIEYDLLICSKPVGDLWIDDKAIHFTGWDAIRKFMEGK